MSITSYAQNFEDVMLWRALSHVSNGFYIDIGAQDPTIDSVSLAFHQQGWRGVHIEPTPHYAELLRQQRAGDIVIQAAIGNGAPIMSFYEIRNTGISTADKEIATQHQNRGFDVHEITVASMPLSAVFETCPQAEIHWLKIDVEGFEQQVLLSWGISAARPWIVVVESTLPLTQIETHQTWETTLISYGYTAVYFDGLNRYYISDAHPELQQAFKIPPNVFDGFALNGTASAPFHKLIETRAERNIAAAQAQLQQYQQSAKAEIAQLAHQLETVKTPQLEQERALHQQYNQQAQQLHQQYASKEQTLIEQQYQTQQQLQQLARQQIEREQSIAAQMLATQQQAAQEKSDLIAAQQLQNQQLQQHYAKREAELLAQANAIQAKLEQWQQQQIQREQGITAQHINAQQTAAQQQTNLIELHQNQQHTLQLQSAAREQVLIERNQLSQQKIADLLQRQVLREQSIAAQRLADQQQADADKQALAAQFQSQAQQCHALYMEREAALNAQQQQLEQQLAALLSQQIQREQDIATQFLAQQQQADASKQALIEQFENQAQQYHALHAEREAALNTQQHQLEQQLAAVLSQQIQREQDIAAQLLAQQQSANEEKTELSQQHQLHTQALQQQITQQQLAQQQLNLAAAERENALSSEIQQREQHAQTLVQHQQIEQQLAQQQIEDCQAVATQLQTEIGQEQALNLQLRQSLSEVQRQLAQTHASLSWRITAPLRSLAAFVTSNGQAAPQSTAPVWTATNPIVNPILLTSIESPSMPIPEPTSPPEIASTLTQLLALHDQQFIHSAYQCVLGRPADPEGFSYYLARLRSGYAKIGLLAQLKSSAEGQAHHAQIQGLEQAIAQYRQGQKPVIGWCLRQLNGGEGNTATERKLRAIENQLFMMSAENQQRFNQLEQALAGVHQLISQQMIANPNARSTAAVLASTESEEIEGLKTLSSSAKDIYFQLKTAAKQHAKRAA